MTMRRRRRGFRLGCKMVKPFAWVLRRRSKRRATLHSPGTAARAISLLCKWGRSLKHGAKVLCGTNSMSGYDHVGRDAAVTRSAKTPKGHLAVYVGEKGGDSQRVFVPVIYFNHPLFGDLLTEAERVYGFDQPGGIQIPCRISDFENVKTRIASHSRRM